MSLMRHRNMEEDRLRVGVLRRVLGCPVEAVYDLPKFTRACVSGPILDEAKRQHIKDLGWCLEFDEFRDMTTVLIPHARFVEGTAFMRTAALLAVIASVGWALVVGHRFFSMSKIID